MLNSVNYCENCRLACNEKVCPNCGRKKLRAVTDDDYCYVTEASTSLCVYFGELLEEKDVESVLMPWFGALHTRCAMTASASRLYVRYGNLDTAKKVVSDYFDEITENLRKHLLDNAEEFWIDLPVSKKTKRKFKLKDDDAVFVLCEEIVETAASIADTGITEGLEDGHVLQAMTPKAILYINSADYHIVDVVKS